MKALIFDMDGLMIDSERLYFAAEKDIAEAFGKTVREETLWKMMGRKPIEGIRIFVEDLGIPASPEEVLRMRHEAMLQKMKTDLVAMPGLAHIIDRFFPEAKLAIATGAPAEYMDITLDSLNLREKFTVLQASDEIVNGKPDPEIYLETCKKLNLDPADCIVLEDSSNGALAGKRAGCYCVAVPNEYTDKQNFDFVDYRAKDLYDAASHIEARPLQASKQ
jgi:HAD superfamily hydrolase (TIGR01509 family)